jgi:hypothetical protein
MFASMGIPSHATAGITGRIVEFLRRIGLTVRFAAIPGPTFLPGIAIQNGTLTIDESNLLYPGDLLHEAGHLAVLPPSRRAVADGDMGDDGGLEIGPMAWSYAAALHLNIPPEVVFHPAGYRGNSQAIIENFAQGHTFGQPILEWAALTVTTKHAKSFGVPPFPAMLKWLRDE